MVSVFFLLGVIGYLFYQRNASMMGSEMRFKMLYQARMIETKLMMAEKYTEGNLSKETLSKIRPQWFKIGFFNDDHLPLYSEISKPPRFNEEFYSHNDRCYTVIPYSSSDPQVKYIVLREDVLKKNLALLKQRIIYYLIVLFLCMAVVGYFLSKLFLRPVREKIEALDRFIEDTTHELNTPVSAILMTVQNLKGIEPKKLNRLKASAQRLSTMYDTLSYSLNQKVSNSKQERFDFGVLLQERVETMRTFAESKRITIQYTLTSYLVYTDKESMCRVIDNILSNAIKYSDPESEVTVDLQDSLLTICDTGIGISKQEQQDIFKRYHRFNKERGGFGIGLSIVMKICKESNIMISIDSEKGKGSCFSLNLSSIALHK